MRIFTVAARNSHRENFDRRKMRRKKEGSAPWAHTVDLYPKFIYNLYINYNVNLNGENRGETAKMTLKEFAESRNAQGGAADYPDAGGFDRGGYSAPSRQSAPAEQPSGVIDGFMNIPDGIDEELPFT